jgi:hypothetical protein
VQRLSPDPPRFRGKSPHALEKARNPAANVSVDIERNKKTHKKLLAFGS